MTRPLRAEHHPAHVFGTDERRSGKMTAMRLLLPAVASAALLLAGPAAAGAATFKGRTSQNRAVTVQTAPDGLITLVRLAWRAGCARKGARFTERTDFGPPLAESTLDTVRDAGRYTLRRKGGWRFRVTASMTGQRTLRDAADATTEQWTGTLSASVVVRRNGRVVDRCKVRSKTWTATRVAAR